MRAGKPPVEEMTRRPLAAGNVYRFKGYARNGFRITGVALRGHKEDDGALAGVGVKWLRRGGKSFWYPCETEAAFWEMLQFANACDSEHA